MTKFNDGPSGIGSIQQLHEKIEELECSCQDLSKYLEVAARWPGSNFRNAMVAYLRAYRDFWNAPGEAFEREIKVFRAQWHQSLSSGVNYLAARGYCLAARHFWRKGDLKAAEDWAKRAGILAEPLDFSPLKARSHIALALIKTAACDWSSAETLIRKAEANAPGENRNQAAVKEALGRLRFEQGDFAQAHQHLATSLALWQKCSDDYGQVEVQLLRAHLCYHSADLLRHDRLLEKAGRRCEDLNYQRGLGIIERYRGKVHLQTSGRLEKDGKRPQAEEERRKAVERFAESLRIFDAVGDTADAARSHLSLARAYAESAGTKKEAIAECEKAEDLFRRLKDHVRMATAMFAKALVLGREGTPSRRREAEIVGLLNKAMKPLVALQDRRHLASGFFEIGDLYRRWGNYDKAADYVEAAITLASKSHAERLVARYHEGELTISVEKYAQAALEAKARFDSTNEYFRLLFHDLKQPLGALYMGLMAADLDSLAEGATKRMLRRARDIAEYLNGLCADIFDTWDAERMRHWKRDRKMSLCPQELNLRDIVERILVLVRMLRPRKIRCDNEVGVAVRVWADRIILCRVLTNLFTNTAKFMPEGQIVVEADEETQSGLVRVTVSDNGPGIPKKLRDKVFEGGIQANATAHLGHGLGLYFCKIAIESHGGKIWVDREKTCEEGEDSKNPKRHGTVIHFTLPKKPRGA
jgi:signal transduction histidine kinase